VIGETFETSAPWSRIDAITSAVEAELHRLCASQGIPGRPYLSFRVSQSYQVGVCLYFTMGFCARGVPEADRRYQEIEHRLREVILEAGGSISHHHGVGKVRRDFVRRVQSDAAIMALHAVKRALDPHNVFAAGNQAFGLEFPVPPGPTAETRQREQSEANVG
jgi:alkyldihydroxyacetonephosphate synthase